MMMVQDGGACQGKGMGFVVSAMGRGRWSMWTYNAEQAAGWVDILREMEDPRLSFISAVSPWCLISILAWKLNLI